MPLAARIMDATSHGAPLGSGPGSKDVRIGGVPAWRALPAGATGAALESVASAIQSFMSTPVLTPADAAAQLAHIQSGLANAAGSAASEGNPAAASAAGGATAGLTTANATLSATWATASAPPGAMPAASAAYTEGIKAALAAAAGAVFAAIAGAADMHNCPLPCPNPPHGPGVVTRGSQTVRINGLPAVRQGDKVIEACGGSDPIAAGCATVQIGDLSPAGASIAEPTPDAAPDDAAQVTNSASPAPVSAPGPNYVGPLLPPPLAAPARPSWIGIVLRDFDDTPMPNQDFTVTLRGGQVLSGRTNAQGYMRFDGVQPDQGDVTFIRIPDAREQIEEKSRGSQPA